MKRIFVLAMAALMLAASCQKTVTNPIQNTEGYLSFSEFTLNLDEEVVTKATAASGNYVVIIYDAESNEVVRKTYAEVKNNDNKISLPAGNYTLVARSTEEDVPVAAFEAPVYSVTKNFSISAGEVTPIGELVCTLAQCKVTVSYSDEFIESVTGPGVTKVTITSGHPLDYVLNADGTYEQHAGYFAVNEGHTMEVVFTGSIDGTEKKMSKIFDGITTKQWRQVKFVHKKNEQGNATFDIVIDDLISDDVLNNDILASEDVKGDDPEAPKGDGGICLLIDHESGCDPQITDLENILVVPTTERIMKIKFKAVIPNGIKSFTVNIDSDNKLFMNAVELADAININLIKPSQMNEVIFSVVPFPHGEELLGKTEVLFDLSNAQAALTGANGYVGTHKFTMTITDQTGCKNVIPVKMIVE